MLVVIKVQRIFVVVKIKQFAVFFVIKIQQFVVIVLQFNDLLLLTQQFVVIKEQR